MDKDKIKTIFTTERYNYLYFTQNIIPKNSYFCGISKKK